MTPAQALQTARPLRIGTCVSRSGDLSATGSMFEKGLKLWAREINARGGIQGREAVLVVKDDGSDPARTAKAYHDLTGSGQVDLLLGPSAAYLTPAVLQALKASRMPCVLAMGAPEDLWGQAGGLAFGLQAPLPEWLSGFFEILSKNGTESVALLVVDHPNSATVVENGLGWAHRYGLEVAASAICHSSGLTDAVRKVAGSGAGAVIVWGSSAGCANAIRQLKRSAAGRKPIFVSSSQPPAVFLTMPARDMEGVFTSLPWDERTAQVFDGGDRFVSSFRAAYGHAPDYAAASAFAGGQLIEAAAAKAGSLGRDDLRLALAGLDTLTILGRYGVDPTGRQLRQFPLTLQMQKGRPEVVWPEDLRTARPAVTR